MPQLKPHRSLLVGEILWREGECERGPARFKLFDETLPSQVLNDDLLSLLDGALGFDQGQQFVERKGFFTVLFSFFLVKAR